jgi:hypothetical protein
MEIQYESGEFAEADVTASSSEFASMAERVTALAAAGTGEVVFLADGRELAALAVRIEAGPAVIAIGNGVLSVSGGCEAIELFAGNMPVESSLPAGYHVHFEHAGREWFVAAESVPLVMVVSAPDT